MWLQMTKTVFGACILIGVFFVLSHAAVSVNTRTVCHSKKFKASCMDGHFLLVSRAFYGIRKGEKCGYERNGPYCSADVRSKLQNQCFKKNNCEVEAKGVALGTLKRGCYEWKNPALDLEYWCLPVHGFHHCGINDQPLKHTFGYLLSPGYPANMMLLKEDCGWTLVPPAAQTLNVTILHCQCVSLYHNDKEVLKCSAGVTSVIVLHARSTHLTLKAVPDCASRGILFAMYEAITIEQTTMGVSGASSTVKSSRPVTTKAKATPFPKPSQYSPPPQADNVGLSRCPQALASVSLTILGMVSAISSF